MNKYEYTDEMSEISGFGGSYEAACRKMVIAGLEWLDEHPDADLKFGGFEGVYGLITDESEDAEALTKHIIAAVSNSQDGGPTGAMHQAAIQHILFIKRNGWDAYVREMSQKDEA